MNGWYRERWWEGSKLDQKTLEDKFDGCTVENRRSMVEYILTVSTSGSVVVNYSANADNGYVSEKNHETVQ